MVYILFDCNLHLLATESNTIGKNSFYILLLQAAFITLLLYLLQGHLSQILQIGSTGSISL